VVKARDETVAFVSDRVKARKAVRGFEADKVARGSLDKAGLGDRFVHRTGRSLDASPRGDGANLDDYETHDVRTLVMGTGFTVAPGVYQPGEWGVRSGVSCYLGDKGLEVTTAVQREIVPLLAK
jgi:Xaa-Pro aminopeptidase